MTNTLDKIKLLIYSYDGKFNEVDDIDSVNFEAKNYGSYGILKNHFPIVATLDVSILSFKVGDKKDYISLSGGVLDFNKNVCTVIAETYEFKQYLDKERILKSKEKAEEALKNKTKLSQNEIINAEFSLKKAINRLKLFK